MMANYSQISMDLEQSMQMLTNTVVAGVGAQSQHQQMGNYYASSQSLFDPSASPSSTASSSASSVNGTPSSKMDYHTFNTANNASYNNNNNNNNNNNSTNTTSSSSSTPDASGMYGNTKRSKSNLAFPNLYQNNSQQQQQQQQNGSFRAQLMHSQSANNDLIQDRSSNSITQDVNIKLFFSCFF